MEPFLSLWSLFYLCGAYFIFVETVGIIPETVRSIPETVGSNPDTVVCFQKQLGAIQKQLCASRNSRMLLRRARSPPRCPSSLVSVRAIFFEVFRPPRAILDPSTRLKSIVRQFRSVRTHFQLQIFDGRPFRNIFDV